MTSPRGLLRPHKDSGQRAFHERRASDRRRLAHGDRGRDASCGTGKLAGYFPLTEGLARIIHESS
jgi:hypothetical protein